MTTPALPITADYKSVQTMCKPNRDASVWFAKINLDVITVTVYMLIFLLLPLNCFFYSHTSGNSGSSVAM